MKLEELFETSPSAPADREIGKAVFNRHDDYTGDKAPSTKRKGQRAQRRLRSQHGRGNESKNAKSYQEQDRY